MRSISRRDIEQKARDMLINSSKAGSDGIPVGIAAVKFQSVLERLVRQRTQQLRQQGVRLVD
jgi:hypothetical protein